jgi:hypothetical protein
VWRLVLALAALVSSGLAQPSVAQDKCNAEVGRLGALARDLKISIAGAPGLKVGDAVQVSWTLKQPLPAGVPVYAVLAVPGEARFEIKVTPPEQEAAVDEINAGESVRALPGFLALTPEAHQRALSRCARDYLA